MEHFEEKEIAALLKKFAALCAKRECAPSEIELKLADYPEEIRRLIVEKLKEENFLSESRFAEAYVKDKFRFNQWGKKKIALMLRKQGIGDEEIKNALAQIKKTEYVNLAEKLLQQKLRQITGKSVQQQRASLLRFGLSRGFEAELLTLLIKKLTAVKK